MLKTDAPGSHGCLVINTLVELPERADVVDDQISHYDDMLLTGFTAASRRTTAVSHHELQNLAHTLLALAMTINLYAWNRYPPKW